MKMRQLAAIILVHQLVGWSLLPLTFAQPSQRSEHSEASKTIQVFILSGQSNMEGLGGSGRLSPELASQPGIKIWSAILAGPDPTEWKPLGGGFGVGKGFGPEVALGYELQKAMPGKEIVLIKSARSGTSISQNGRVNFHPDGGNNEYAALIRRVKAALADLEKSGRRVSLEAMFWMQGESDSLDRNNQPDSPEQSSERYGANFRQFITSVRKDLAVPELPVIAGRLPTNLVNTVFRGNTFTRAHQVIAGQDEVAADPAMNTFLVHTDDVSLGGDDLHFDTEGQLQLGRLFAREYEKIASQKRLGFEESDRPDSDLVTAFGPAVDGLRLGFHVASRTNQAGYRVTTTLTNTTERAITLEAIWMYDDQGDFDRYIQAAASVLTWPPITPWRGQIEAASRQQAQPTLTLPAGASHTIVWETDLAKLKSIHLNPLVNHNPNFPLPGLYAVHLEVTIGLKTGNPERPWPPPKPEGDSPLNTLWLIEKQRIPPPDRLIRLRSNEIQIAVNGDIRQPRHTYGHLSFVNAEEKTAKLKLGSLQGVEKGDRFHVPRGNMGKWEFQVTDLEPEMSWGSLTFLAHRQTV